jgi:hypothetical protein
MPAFTVLHDRPQQPAAAPALSSTSDLLALAAPDGSSVQLLVRG